MKKLGTAICLSSTLFAVAAQAQGNWLLGVSGGYGAREGRNNITLINATVAPGRQSILALRQEDNGWMWGLLGGYQVSCNRWLLGLELNVDWRNYQDSHPFAFTDASNVGWAASYSYERDWVLGLTGRLGYQVAPHLLPYIRVGAEWSRDELTLDATSVLAAVASVSGRNDSYRLVAGVGLEFPMAVVPVISHISFLSYFAVRLEYDYHSTGQAISATGLASEGSLVAASMNPHEQSGTLSLVWNF